MTKNQKSFFEYSLMYSAGSVIYAATELAFRGFTHWTMVITGGVCSALIHFQNKKLKNKRLYIRCLAGAVIITSLELIVGIIVNKILHWGVWDYSKKFLNFQGQICPLFTFFWFLISIPAVKISSFVASECEKYY